jgi:hypothetical protein
LSLLIVLTAVSASQAGLFGRGRARYDNYYYPTCSQGTVSTQQASVPAAGQPTASTAGPIVYTAAKPIIGENAAGAAVSVPQGNAYAPAPVAYPSAGWSTSPRSSWDFGSGSFPPYH